MTDMRDAKYDYFRTSDGRLWKVPRNFEREAMEAKNEAGGVRLTRFNAFLKVCIGVVIFVSGFIFFTALAVLLFS